MAPVVSIKVDVDTREGARRGLPRLLDLFGDLGIAATFFCVYGPDNSGRAILNVFRRGFLRKMVRTRALRLYGLRTIFSGTLLPAPLIGRGLEPVLGRLRAEGHEVGVHGWDHRRWQDRLAVMRSDEVAGELARAVDAHERVTGEPPHAFAAPGWVIDDRALIALERLGVLYTSSTRFGPPFRPFAAGRALQLVEVPSTTLCPEEVLSRGERGGAFPRIDETEVAPAVVYPAHAEVEGGALFDSFRAWLVELLERGAVFVRLEELARRARTRGRELPVRAVRSVSIPGRAAEVSTGFPELCPAHGGPGGQVDVAAPAGFPVS